MFTKIPFIRVKVHDLHSDPLGWKSRDTSLTLDTNLYKLVTDASPRGDKNVSIVIDNLSNIILYRSAAYTCQVLNQFMQAKQREGE